MHSIRKFRFKLPLIFRVVACYAAIGSAAQLITSLQPEPKQAAATNVVRQQQPTSDVTFSTSKRISGQPSQIEIARLGINLQIVDGNYDQANNSWTLTDDKAQFATMTDLPNDESGNTFIYGHDRPAIFAPLKDLQEGDEVTVRATNGKSFIYTFNGQQIVNPDATSILAPSKDPILTLMTCEGVFSEARRVVVFNFKEVV